MKRIFLAVILIGLIVSCSHKNNIKTESGIVIEETGIGTGKANKTPQKVERDGKSFTGITKDKDEFVPNATAFKMSGNYANKVAVTISPDGVLTYFPAPSDITADSEPIELCDGWWLNCQGLGPTSVFTKYSFAEYASLPEAPSPDQIKLEIIHGAKVTEFIELPFLMDAAVNNIEEVKNYIRTK